MKSRHTERKVSGGGKEGTTRGEGGHDAGEGGTTRGKGARRGGRGHDSGGRGKAAGKGTRRRGLFEAGKLVARDDAVLLEGIGPVIDVGIAVVGAVEGFGTG